LHVENALQPRVRAFFVWGWVSILWASRIACTSLSAPALGSFAAATGRIGSLVFRAAVQAVTNSLQVASFLTQMERVEKTPVFVCCSPILVGPIG
jgi:hypothetical protein